MTTFDHDPHVKDHRSLLAKALDGRGVIVKIVDDFVGTGGRLEGVPLALRALSNDERVKCIARSVAFLLGPCGMSEEHCFGQGQGAFERDLEAKVQILALALVEPAPPHARVAASADDLRTLLDADEITQLFEIYADHIAERSPISSAATVEEVEAVIVALGKGTIPASRLTRYDTSTLRSTIVSLAVRLETLTSSRSSPTSPSSASAATPTSVE